MSEEVAPAEASAEASAPSPKKGKGKYVVILLVLALAGGGAFWWQRTQAAEPGAQAVPEVKPGVVVLDPFVVNLADPGGRTFIRLTMRLLVPDEAIAAELNEDDIVKLRVRASILELISTKQGAELVTPDGKTALKKAIAERASALLHETKVTDVLFTDFVVQF